MPKTIICPFWKWEQGDIAVCEGCRLTFPDQETRLEYVRRYCGSSDWKRCSVAKGLLEFYDKDDEGGRSI